MGPKTDISKVVDSRVEGEKSDRRAVDALYKISALASSEPDPKLALEGILDEIRLRDDWVGPLVSVWAGARWGQSMLPEVLPDGIFEVKS